VIGLPREEVSKLTIFSLVQPDKLSNLFEMVAEALRGDRRKSRRVEDLNDRDVGQNQRFYNHGGGSSDTSDNKGRVSESSSVNKRLGSDSSDNKEYEIPSSSDGRNRLSSSCISRINSESTSNREHGSESSRDREHGSESSGNERNGSESSGNTTNETSKSSNRCDIAAMTLPCISFPSQMKVNNVSKSNPLYMTIALMTDDDPSKRCFHCIISDDPGTKGTVGFVTPELLALLVVPEQPRQVQAQNVSSSSKFATVSNSSYGEDNMAESFLFNNEEDSEDEDDDDDNVDTAR
jgi:hypothetical protein